MAAAVVATATVAAVVTAGLVVAGVPRRLALVYGSAATWHLVPGLVAAAVVGLALRLLLRCTGKRAPDKRTVWLLLTVQLSLGLLAAERWLLKLNYPVSGAQAYYTATLYPFALLSSLNWPALAWLPALVAWWNPANTLPWLRDGAAALSAALALCACIACVYQWLDSKRGAAWRCAAIVALAAAAVSQLHVHSVSKDYRVLEARHSLTGYVAVVEGRESRLMRCDHSLLGGVFVESGDSVFAVFHLLEAARLLQQQQADRKLTALQIGLGCGIAASALHTHGYAVDVAEIDPVVYSYAVKHFSFPVTKGRVFLQDARELLDSNATHGAYDIILHDVFTGGTVPGSLFTVEAFRGVLRALRPNGVFVLNMAGDPNSRALRAVFTTFRTVFPNSRCFIESVPHDVKKESSFRNVVLFASEGSLKFRPAEVMDALGSEMRAWVLTEYLSWEVEFNELARNGTVLVDATIRLDSLDHHERDFAH
eukprot:jgi/Chlat1/7130/Chrsp57S06812